MEVPVGGCYSSIAAVGGSAGFFGGEHVGVRPSDDAGGIGPSGYEGVRSCGRG